jgi:hypothetical protein
MDSNTTSNNVWICKFCQKTLSKKYNYQSHMDRCKVYRDHLKSNSIDEEFKQQLKHDILNEVKMFLNDLKNDVVNAKTNNNIRKTYSFNIS